ncbi:MAG: L-threonylcarbamoyladenylate synthase [Bacteroidota bacterium]
MLLKVHPDNPDPKRIRKIVECLNAGGIIIYPTDTVYAIGCSLLHQKAVEKVAQIKGIKLAKANFSLVCYDLSHLSEYCKPIQNATYKLMKKSLPGPFTYILDANNNVPKLFKSKKKTIGIRVPDNNIPRDIVNEMGNPLISTSVHDEDEILQYTTDPELIYEKYKNRVDLVIDGGFCKNVASTVVDCTEEVPEIIRQGVGEL